MRLAESVLPTMRFISADYQFKTMEIRRDNIESAEVVELLTNHLKNMQGHTPPESVHALDLSAYHEPDLTLWTAWSENQLMGCGALKDLGFINGERVGEIKSMRTKEAFLRQGVADAVLNTILESARAMDLQRLSLETGATEHFKAAREFYRTRGFEKTGPFADYTDDPHSSYFTVLLL